MFSIWYQTKWHISTDQFSNQQNLEINEILSWNICHLLLAINHSMIFILTSISLFHLPCQVRRYKTSSLKKVIMIKSNFVLSIYRLSSNAKKKTARTIGRWPCVISYKSFRNHFQCITNLTNFRPNQTSVPISLNKIFIPIRLSIMMWWNSHAKCLYFSCLTDFHYLAFDSYRVSRRLWWKCHRDLFFLHWNFSFFF